MSAAEIHLPPALAARDLSLEFGGHRVLRDVSLAVRPGEVLGLVGPNGAGKSALMNCLTGVYRPGRATRILVAGRAVEHLPSHARRRLGLARTFQHANLVGGLSVLDNVLLGLAPDFRGGLAAYLARPFRAAAQEAALRGRALAVLEACGLGAYAHLEAGALPLGIGKQVDLARALVGRPGVLLLDEPASGLSREERARLPRLVAEAQMRDRLAVLWIEHDLDLVLSMADRVMVLHHGEAVAVEETRASPAARERVVDAYLNGR